MSAPRNHPDDPSPDDERNNPRSGGADKLPFSKLPFHKSADKSASKSSHKSSHNEYRQQGEQEQEPDLRDKLIEASLSNHVAPVAWSIGRDRIATIREWLAWQEILCSHPELDL